MFYSQYFLKINSVSLDNFSSTVFWNKRKFAKVLYSQYSTDLSSGNFFSFYKPKIRLKVEYLISFCIFP